MTKPSLIQRLIRRIDETQNPIVVGLDPLIERIPEHLTAEAAQRYGESQEADLAAIGQFNLQLLEEIAPLVPAVKLQKACYELYGPGGLLLFEQTAQKARSMGLIVIDDSKRGDIGSTATLYAKGLIGGAPKEARPPASDYLTVNPYLGWDGIDPFLDVADQTDKGLFLLVRTSNPSASQYQEARIEGMPLYEKIALDLEAHSRTRIQEEGFSNLGAVVGATWPKEAARLREIMPSVFFLVPGYGAQGGTGETVASCFNQEGYGALINSSRGIIFAYQDQSMPKELQKPESFAQAAKEAVLRMRSDLNQALKAQGKLPRRW